MRGSSYQAQDRALHSTQHLQGNRSLPQQTQHAASIKDTRKRNSTSKMGANVSNTDSKNKGHHQAAQSMSMERKVANYNNI